MQGVSGMETLKRFLKGIMWEAEGPSLTRVLTVFAVLLFALVTVSPVAAACWDRSGTSLSIQNLTGLPGRRKGGTRDDAVFQ